MSKSLLTNFHAWHRKLASILFIFFFFVSVTAIMLAWKSFFTTIIFDNQSIKPSTSLQKWLPMDSLEIIAIAALNEQTNNNFKSVETIQLKPAKGYISFFFKHNYSIQVDGATGAAIHIEQKNGSLIQDIHDGAIVDEWFSSKLGVTKKIYSTIMGLS